MSARRVLERLPFDPLMQFVNTEDYIGEGTRSTIGPNKILSDRLHVDRQTVYRWRKDGLSIYQADMVAVRLGLHPILIWPEWLDISSSEAT